MYSKCNDLLAYQVIIDAFSSPICLVFSACQIASRYATTREVEALLMFDVWLLYLEKSRICSLILIKGLRGQIRRGKFEIAFSLYQTVLMFSRRCLSLSENMVPKNVFVSMIVGQYSEKTLGSEKKKMESLTLCHDEFSGSAPLANETSFPGSLFLPSLGGRSYHSTPQFLS